MNRPGRISRIKIALYLVSVFLKWCWQYPKDIKENYQDAKNRYYFETDPEMTELMRKIGEL